jgi:predicted acetyltransferase
VPEARTITDDELRTYLLALRTAFFGEREVTDEQLAWAAKAVDRSRTFAAFDDGRLCGTARSFATDVSLPGGEAVPAGAVTQVTVLPTDRRRGHLTRMMRAQLDDIAARGEACAVLIASEWPIYGQFGYGQATEWVTLSVDTRHARFVSTSPTGSFELVDRPTLREAAPEPFERNRRLRPGAIARDEHWWNRLLGVEPRPGDTPSAKEVRAVYRSPAGRIDGYVVYEPKEKWEDGVSKAVLETREVIAATPEAHREIWRFLCSIDLAREVHAWPSPVDEVLPHLLVDGRAVRWRERSDHLWLRPIDVPTLLASRRYAAPGRVVLDVVDDLLGCGGRFELDAGTDGATCAPAPAATPDLTLPVSMLGAALLGGTSLRALAAAGHVDADDDRALERADAMFSWRPAPFLTTFF